MDLNCPEIMRHLRIWALENDPRCINPSLNLDHAQNAVYEQITPDSRADEAVQDLCSEIGQRDFAAGFRLGVKFMSYVYGDTTVVGEFPSKLFRGE